MVFVKLKKYIHLTHTLAELLLLDFVLLWYKCMDTGEIGNHNQSKKQHYNHS